jgi:UPF0716 protein FxsA
VFGLLLLLLLATPFIELWVIVVVWQSVGGIETLALLLGISVVGAWLVRREGLGVWGRLNEQLLTGNVPTVEIVDGALILFSGALLLTPGFVTDAVALALLVPPVRAGLRALVRRRLARRVERTGAVRVVRFGSTRAGFGDPLAGFGGRPPGGGGDRAGSGGIIDVEGTERPGAGSEGPDSGSGPPAGETGARRRGAAGELDR